MISQSRLRDIILAAQDFDSALRKLKLQIEAMKDLDPSPGILSLASLSLESLLERPSDSIRTLAQESERLRLTWKRNQRRNARRRAPKLGVEGEADLQEYEAWKAGFEEEKEKP